MDAVTRTAVGENVARLMAHMPDGSGYDAPWEEVRDMQVAALNERLQEQVGKIRMVRMRADDAGIERIDRLEDIVPLLLPHTAYKSYPEKFLIDERWDKLTKWLATVSAHPVENVDLDGVEDIDHWIARLERAGHYVSCTSGTTGKAAMLIASDADMEFVSQDAVAACAWGSGIRPAQDRLMFGLAPVADVPRNRHLRQRLYDAFAIPGSERFNYPIPPITIGSITRMIALRKAIAAGTATPSQIAEFEDTSAERQKAMDQVAGVCADALIAVRGKPLYISGFWAALHGIATEVRGRGFSGKDFNPENTCFIAGGLKGASLPPDYKDFIFETFNLRPERNYQMYGMQEIHSSMPRCRNGGRYHVPPWLVCLPLDKPGENLVPIGPGEIEGRAAFFDLSLDGRWGGVISGDRIHVDFGPCECGARSPSIRDDIVRYSDLDGDDKITCSGTVDAYVRGIS